MVRLATTLAVIVALWSASAALAAEGGAGPPSPPASAPVAKKAPDNQGAAGRPAADKPESEKSSPPVDAAKVAELVNQLGDAAFATREAAEAQLKALGPAAMPVLDPLLAKSSDLEILRRLERVYRSLVPAAEYQGATPQPGFLGISYSVADSDDEARLAERQWAVVVNSVVAGSPAETGGLQAGDLIVALEGEQFIGDASTNFFSERLLSIGEGAEARLTLLRSGERREVTVTLASRRGMDSTPTGGVVIRQRVVIVPQGGAPQVIEPDNRDVPQTAAQELPKADERVLAYRWSKYWAARLAKLRGPPAQGAAPGKTESRPAPAADAPPQEAKSQDNSRPKEKTTEEKK